MARLNAWKPETTRGTTTFDALYYYGITENVEPGRFVEINKQETYSSQNYTLTPGNTPMDKHTTSYNPVNGLPLYWFYGKATATTGGVDITPKGAGGKPSIGSFSQDTYTKYGVKGLVSNQLDFGWKIGKPLSINQSFIGLSHGASTASPTASWLGSISTPFTNLDPTDGFKWNGTRFEAIDVSVINTHAVQGFLGSDGYYSHINDTGPMAIGGTIAVWGDFSAIMTDYLAKTPRTLLLKWIKDDPTKYILLTGTNTYIVNGVSIKNDIGVPVAAAFNYIVSSPSWRVIDGIATTNYGL